jgi:hypothetical protein
MGPRADVAATVRLPLREAATVRREGDHLALVVVLAMDPVVVRVTVLEVAIAVDHRLRDGMGAAVEVGFHQRGR